MRTVSAPTANAVSKDCCRQAMPFARVSASGAENGAPQWSEFMMDGIRTPVLAAAFLKYSRSSGVLSVGISTQSNPRVRAQENLSSGFSPGRKL